jgi:two-component system, OmpR family, sensor kinase
MRHIWLRLYSFLQHSMQRLSIRWRIALVSLGLLTILLVALGILILFATERTLMTNQATALHNEARLAVGGIRNHPFFIAEPSASVPPTASFPTDLQHSAQVLADKLASPSNYVSVITPFNEVISSSDNEPFLPPPRVVLPLSTIQQVVATLPSDSSYELAKDVQGKRQLVVLVPLVSQHKIVAVLQISSPTQSNDDFVTTLRIILLLGGVGAMSLAIILTFPLIAAALHPLVEMERTSRRIAEGELSMRLRVPVTDDEIGHLALSFNQMVAQLEEAFKRQKRFVADASHELRTPLTALSGSLEMLLMGADQGDLEATRRLTRGMYAEVKRMHRLVEDLLALTRLDEGRVMPRQERVDMGSVLEKIYEQALQLSRGQEVRSIVASGMPPAIADPDSMQQVLLNIVDNALKFSRPDDGLVELRARSDGAETIIIEVRDNGRGIAPQDLPHVFDRFYRADSSRTRSSQRVGGNGLGLAIAKELIEAQGGQIAISSILNVGTTITIRLNAARIPVSVS